MSSEVLPSTPSLNRHKDPRGFPFYKGLLWHLQDVLVVTAPGSGAETIPFLKTWVNLPMAIGFTVLYAKVQCAFVLLQCLSSSAHLRFAVPQAL